MNNAPDPARGVPHNPDTLTRPGTVIFGVKKHPLLSVPVVLVAVASTNVGLSNVTSMVKPVRAVASSMFTATFAVADGVGMFVSPGEMLTVRGTGVGVGVACATARCAA